MRRLSVAAPLLLAAAPAEAHLAHGGHPLAWSWEPWVLVLLAASLAAYAAGVHRARRRSPGRGPFTAARLAAFAGGYGTAFLALTSPVDTVGAELFSVHMVQHLMLTLLAAPLLAWARPALAFLWCLPRGARRAIGGWWSGPAGRVAAVLRSPAVVWAAFCGIFVFWHLPGPYAWALGSEWIHALEHASFFVSAFAFWALVLEGPRQRRLDYGATLLFVATAAALSGLPGALMAIATRPFYDGHAAGALAWGLTPLEDQQLAGLIMWIPGGIVYLATIAGLFVLWLRSAERRAARTAAWAARFAPLVLLALPLLSACDDRQEPARSAGLGDAAAGAQRVAAAGCGTCHVIPGIEGASGLVGPPLDHMGRRIYIAGLLRNTPENMVLWLRTPQRVVPGVVMPDVGLTDAQARDVTAYLYTLD